MLHILPLSEAVLKTPGIIKISSISILLTQLPVVSACLMLSHSSILSAGSKVTALKVPLQGQEHPDPHRKPEINKLDPTSSVLTLPTAQAAAGDQPTRPLVMGTQPGKQLQPTQAVALRGVWALVTTALPTFIPTHLFQEPESQEKWGRKKQK